MVKLLTLAISLTFITSSWAQEIKLGLVQYQGGGDWYANLDTSLPNLAAFANKNLGTKIDEEQAIVSLDDPSLYQYPFLHLTGHGNIVLSDAEVNNLRNYLLAGGFLHIDDNYGMDKFIRPQLKRVFTELDLVELPSGHPIFHQTFDFAEGLPKIHEHDNNRPQALGLIKDGKLLCLYTYESDLGDGWEDPRIHNDTQENHIEALQMGANILEYIFMNAQKNG